MRRISFVVVVVLLLGCGGLGGLGGQSDGKMAPVSREEFEKKMRGRSLDAIRELLGDPDEMPTMTMWQYNKRTINPRTKTIDDHVLLMQNRGRVTHFSYPDDPPFQIHAR